MVVLILTTLTEVILIFLVTFCKNTHFNDTHNKAHSNSDLLIQLCNCSNDKFNWCFIHGHCDTVCMEFKLTVRVHFLN